MRGLPATRFIAIIVMPILVVALLCGPAFAQSITSRPTFEIADVHSSGYASNPYTYMSGGLLRAERYDLRKATMLDLISTAYNVDPKYVSGGSNWLELDRFDISAKAPAKTPPETLRLMLQSLLEERFKLVLHTGTRPMPAFVLTMSKGTPKMTESQGPGDPGCQYRQEAGSPFGAMFSCHKMTMGSFAQELQDIGGDYVTEPVVDGTGLDGSWDFDLQWNWRSQMLPSGTMRTTLFDALEKQLGLSLELKTAPAPAIVVDHVNESPTENPPGVEQVLPQRTLEFEVADIKRSPPGEMGFYKLYPGGLFSLKGISMKILIATAWDMDWDHVDNTLLGAPKWIDSVNFDINAKTSPDSGQPARSGFMDDDLRLMLRALLIDRFKMVTHYENRPVTAYTLVSDKPKMAKADPSNRSGCHEGGAMKNDPRDKNPLLSRLVVCKNMTMAQFARAFQGVAPGYVPNEVIDGTGLEGGWDFTLSFSSAGLLQDSLRDEENKSDPNGGVSLFEAVRKQMGLKLEMHKRVMPVLVIDKMEENPTDN